MSMTRAPGAGPGSRRSPPRKLSVLALAALACYVLACRPGFSPDGSKILVTMAGGPEKQSRLLVYDRKASKWSPLLTVADASLPDGLPVINAGWSPDGKQVVAAWASSEDSLSVTVLPQDGRGPTRFLQVGHIDEAMSVLLVPPVVHRRHLIFGGETIGVLDLGTGETDREPLAGNDNTNAPKKTIHLVGQGGSVYYVLTGQTNAELGRLDLSDLKHPRPRPLLRLTGDKELNAPFMATSRASARLALTRGDADDQRLEIYRQGRLEQTVHFGATNNGIILGNLAWSRDGKTLYATGFRPLAPGPIAKAKHAGYQALRAVGLKPDEPPPLDLQVTVCEIAMAGGALRETPVFRVSTRNNDGYLAYYQLALAPDGGTIAISSGVSESDRNASNEAPSLYLLNLSRPNRPVTRIRIPPPTTGAAGFD